MFGEVPSLGGCSLARRYPSRLCILCRWIPSARFGNTSDLGSHVVTLPIVIGAALILVIGVKRYVWQDASKALMAFALGVGFAAIAIMLYH